MSFMHHSKKQEDKANEEKPDQVLKWDFEKENEKFDLTNNEFTPMIDLNNNLLKSTSFQKKNSFGLYRQLTIESAKNKIIRSKTAASLKNKELDLVEVLDEKGNTLKINKNLLLKAQTDIQNNFLFYKNNIEEDISDYFTFVDTDGISKRVTLKDSNNLKNDLNESTDMIDYKNLYYNEKNEDFLDDTCLKNFQNDICKSENQYFTTLVSPKILIKKYLINEKTESLNNDNYLLLRLFRNRLYVSRNYIKSLLLSKQKSFDIENNEMTLMSNLSELNFDKDSDYKKNFNKLYSDIDENINSTATKEQEFIQDEFLPVKMQIGRWIFKTNGKTSESDWKNFNHENDAYLNGMIEKNKYILELDLSPEQILSEVSKFDQDKQLNYQKLLKDKTNVNSKDLIKLVNRSLNVISRDQSKNNFKRFDNSSESFDDLINKCYLEKLDFLIDLNFLNYVDISIN